MKLTTTAALGAAIAGACALVAAGCDDDVNPQSPPDHTGTGGQGTGGSGGSTGNGGGGAEGGAGGGAGGCLEPASYAAVFTLAEPSLCVVATYPVPLHLGFDMTTYVSIVPSWGRHGGPLTLEQTYDTGTPVDEVTLTRWQAPAESGTELEVAASVGPVTLGTSDPNPYLNAAAVDLPFFDWTAVGWAAFGAADGELLLLAGNTVDELWPVEGMFAATGLSGTGDRLFLSALSPLDAPGAATAGLYYADVCSGPALCGGGAVTTGGDASGVVTTDTAGNLFATFPDIGGGTQAVFGYHASEIAPGSDPQGAGSELMAPAGSGTALAALAPTAGSDGYLLFQPFDGTGFVNLDPIVQRYADDGPSLAAVGAPTPALTMATAGAEVTLMSDDAGQIWVGVADGDGTSTFFVLAPTP